MSYQPEERYWTDYLRIALPVVGLLLMLGLFWYWASKVIGDTGNSAKPTATAQVAVITAAAPTATTPALVQLTPQPAETATNAAGPATESNSTAANGANAGTNGSTANPTATSTTGNGSGNGANSAAGNGSSDNGSSSANPSQFKKGDTVVTNTGDVNLRADHTTDSDAIDTLAEGTELNVIGDAGVNDGGYTWIQVQNPATGEEGWVADSLVSAG